MQILDFYIFLSTNFAGNMNVSLPSNRFLPYFGEIPVNALELQNYRDYFIDGLGRKELCALECIKMHKNGIIISKNYSGIFH